MLGSRNDLSTSYKLVYYINIPEIFFMYVQPNEPLDRLVSEAPRYLGAVTKFPIKINTLSMELSDSRKTFSSVLLATLRG